MFLTGSPTIAYAPPNASGSGMTIIVQPDGGRVELTEHDAQPRSIPYADAWSSQAPIAAVIEKMRRRIATLPRKVYQHAAGNRVTSMPAVGGKPPRTRKASPEEICDPGNGICDLLWHPLPGFGEMSLAEWQYLSLFVNGGSLLAKYRGNGASEPPTEFLPLDWRFLQAWARIGQPVVLWATVQTGAWKWLLPSETLFTSWTTVAGANGAWLCTSPLEQLGVTIKIDEAAQRYAAAFFKNAARPSVIFTLPPDVNVREAPTITSRLQENIQETYGGVDQAFRSAVIGGGATIQQWGTSAQEAQMVETREQDFREVCAVFDMPFDAMFGISSATPEGEAQVWKAIGNWAKLGDDRFNAQVIHAEPEWAGQRFFVKTDLNDVLYGDPLVLSDKLIAEAEAGIISRNEARISLGRDARDDPGADELIYNVPSAGLVGDLPGSASVAEEEREMVMPPPGELEPLEKLDTTLGSAEGG
jgi:HK97 family phage portal protein